MAFSIRFLDLPPEYPYEDASTKAARGRIVLGNWSEEFLSSLYEWNQAEYREQWTRSIQSLLEGTSKAALITTFGSPATASHLVWWPLYRVGEHVFVQNHLLFYKDLKAEFDVKRAVEFLRDRQTVNEDRAPISEWSVSMDDLRAFGKVAS